MFSSLKPLHVLIFKTIWSLSFKFGKGRAGAVMPRGMGSNISIVADYVGLEKVSLVGWNSTNYALNLNSTASKIAPLRANASIYISGSGFDWKSLKTCFGFQRKNNQSKQLRFLILILLTWCLTQFSLLALRVKVRGLKGQLNSRLSNCFLI